MFVGIRFCCSAEERVIASRERSSSRIAAAEQKIDAVEPIASSAVLAGRLQEAERNMRKATDREHKSHLSFEQGESVQRRRGQRRADTEAVDFEASVKNSLEADFDEIMATLNREYEEKVKELNNEHGA